MLLCSGSRHPLALHEDTDAATQWMKTAISLMDVDTDADSQWMMTIIRSIVLLQQQFTAQPQTHAR